MEFEMTPANRVDDIHDTLVALEGERLRVRANMGRSRIIERTGILVGVHPSLFLIEAEARRGRTVRMSYQYADVLTGSVELFNTDTGEKIFDFVSEEMDEDGNEIIDDELEDEEEDE